MLSNRKNIFFWSIQLISWFSLLAIIATTNHLSGINIFSYLYIINLLIWVIISISITSLLRKYINKKRVYERILKSRIFFIIVASFISSITNSFITVTTNIVFFNGSGDFIDYFISISITMFFIYLFWLILYFSFKLFENLQAQKIIATKLQLEKTNFELQALKQQLNPHFLFNSLNSIRALIIEDSIKARHSITQLSNLLRTTLINGKKNLITINEEIELVRNYLELEKIRYDDKLTYKIEYLKSSSLIPPFIIQLLVENAIKHGISKSINGGFIYISIIEDENEITINVKNNGIWIAADSDTKIGLKNIEKRLELTFSKQSSYKVSNENNIVTTIIKINKK